MARRFIVQYRMSCKEMLGGGFYNPPTDDHPVVPYRFGIKMLPSVAARLEPVVLEKQDALELIKKHNRPDTVIYCDPPYPKTTQKHYSGYTLDDLRKLVDVLAKHQGSWMLSNYEQPGLTLPPNVVKYELGTKERLWVRQRIGQLPEMIQKRYDRGDYAIFKG